MIYPTLLVDSLKVDDPVGAVKSQAVKMIDTNRQYILKAGKELGLTLK